MKNFFNGNLIEMIKPLIKQKSNEGVMKMMDIIKEKPESWFEFLSVSDFLTLACYFSSKFPNSQIHDRKLRYNPISDASSQCAVLR